MRLTIETDGDTTRLVGDPAAFFWLLSAAGNARDGFVGNRAPLDGGGTIELVPERPSVDQRPRHRLSRLDATVGGAS